MFFSINFLKETLFVSNLFNKFKSFKLPHCAIFHIFVFFLLHSLLGKYLTSLESIITPSAKWFLIYVFGAQYSIVFDILSGAFGWKKYIDAGTIAEENSCPPKVLGAFLNIDKL